MLVRAYFSYATISLSLLTISNPPPLPQLRLNITAHDTRGRAFSAWLGAGPPAVSRGDLIQAGGTSTLLTAQLRRPGAASVAVAAEAGSNLGDVLFLDVEELVPTAQVSTGR